MEITMVCPCLLGLEGLVKDELLYLEAQNIRPQNGRVVFQGGPEILARANINCRYGERILIQMGAFEAKTFEELFQQVKSLPWELWIGRQDSFPVKGRSLDSQLKSVPDCQAIVKKAVVERLRQKYRISWFEETGFARQIQFLILKDRVSVMLDTSGIGLHKRGYRANAAEAPIKETLAAAMVKLSRVYRDSILFDPFCGSGTILVEGAMYAMHLAPGLRRRFAAERWEQIPAQVWRKERERAQDLIQRDAAFTGFGYDIDENALAIARENAAKAGVSGKLRFERRDIRELELAGERGAVICNPPYGERLLDQQVAQELYRVMGQKLQRKRGWSYTVISPEEQFEQYFGRMADKRRKLYNGMIKCQVYQYFEIRFRREMTCFSFSRKKPDGFQSQGGMKFSRYRVIITTDPGSDFWQRTYYGFQNDNAHVLLNSTKEPYFSFTVKASFQSSTLFDQCGLAIYQNSGSWAKACIEYHDAKESWLGSVVTNRGYSDWSTSEISSSVTSVYYRLSRREKRFFALKIPLMESVFTKCVFSIWRKEAERFTLD